MYNNFILFLSSYFLILFSIIGYGAIFLRIFNNKLKYNFGYIGLCGIFFLILYSYLSNIFFSHSEFHNLTFLIIGLIYFFIFLKKNFQKLRKEFFFTIIVFSLLFISSLIFKNHDDFPYYHFPYTFYLTQQSSYFGIGQFNHGFRTPSSIFYLNSLFFLPLVKYYLFNFSALYILGFSNIILLKKIHVFFKSFNINNNLSSNYNYITFLSLLIFTFINIFFYRIGEHGTDRSAQILIFILIITMLEYFYINKINKIDLLIIYILLGLIISLKAFYILYVIVLLPLFLFVHEKKNNLIFILNYFINNRIFLFIFILTFLVFSNYFFNTGCFVYPVSFTCIENLSWSLPISEVSRMNNWYELWSKAGANPNFRVSDPDQYIVNLNWLSNWINNYFFNKVSDFLLGVLFIILIFFLYCIKIKHSKTKKKRKLDKYSILLLSILIILTFEWFYNHPALRYGGYCLLTLLLFIPTSLTLSRFNISMSKFTNFVFVITLITIFIFLGRNFYRINKEIDFYNYMPLKETFYKIDKHYFRIQNQMDKFEKNKIKTIYGKKVFVLNK